MGVRIKVLLFNEKGIFQWCCQHIAMRVEDMTTQRRYDIDYGKNFRTLDEFLDKDGRSKNRCIGVVTLYSKMKYDDFIKVVKSDSRFQSNDTYGLLNNNCAHAVAAALDILCPNTPLDISCFALRVFCCVPFIASLGMVCFPPPPGLFTPSNVYQRAELLSLTHYGKFETTHSLELSTLGLLAPESKTSMLSPVSTMPSPMSIASPTGGLVITSSTSLTTPSSVGLASPTVSNDEKVSSVESQRLLRPRLA